MTVFPCVTWELIVYRCFLPESQDLYLRLRLVCRHSNVQVMHLMRIQSIMYYHKHYVGPKPVVSQRPLFYLRANPFQKVPRRRKVSFYPRQLRRHLCQFCGDKYVFMKWWCLGCIDRLNLASYGPCQPPPSKLYSRDGGISWWNLRDIRKRLPRLTCVIQPRGSNRVRPYVTIFREESLGERPPIDQITLSPPTFVR